MAVRGLVVEKIGLPEQDDESTENIDRNNLGFLFPRSGHRVVVDDNNLYVLGGYNPKFHNIPNTEDTYYPLFKELWKFNFARREWSLLSTDGSMPIELASHAVLRVGRNLLCFGGTGVPFGSNSSNQLNVCNLDTLKWRHMKCSGQTPQKKYGHTLTKIGKHMYVCGGTSGYTYDLHIHRLDLQTLTWEELPAQSNFVPESRYRHEVACDDSRLFVFGGGTASSTFGFEFVPAFHIPTCQWENIKSIPDPKHGFPALRKCHSCVNFKQDVYICGGFDTQTIFGDIWKFSLQTNTWSKLPCSLQVPVYFHSADITSDGCMYVFGGVSKIDRVRTNCLQRVWLATPTLQEICWEKITSCLDSETLKKTAYLSSFLPMQFIEKLS